MKVMTIVGTRPDIVRLARVMDRLDRTVGQVLVHTGQNYDHQLNPVFFDDLGLRALDHYLAVGTDTLEQTPGGVLSKTQQVLLDERSDAVLVLGDTNPCIVTLMAKRLRNRWFDEDVREEINRWLVDHLADLNLAYTEHARRNLFAERLHPRRVIVTRSSMREVLEHFRPQIEAAHVLSWLGLRREGYFLLSAHCEENVDDPAQLRQQLPAYLTRVHDKWHLPVVVSTHPRTRKRLEALETDGPDAATRWLEPFGFHDYNHLQLAAACVLSDSGTIAEESSILGFTLPELIEPLDAGSVMMTGLCADDVETAVEIALHDGAVASSLPMGSEVTDTSNRVVRFIASPASRHHDWAGIRR